MPFITMAMQPEGGGSGSHGARRVSPRFRYAYGRKKEICERLTDTAKQPMHGAQNVVLLSRWPPLGEANNLHNNVTVPLSCLVKGSSLWWQRAIAKTKTRSELRGERAAGQRHVSCLFSEPAARIKGGSPAVRAQ